MRERESNAQRASGAQQGAVATPNFSAAPALGLPKGGGAIRGVGEKFSANAATGTGKMSVPLPLSPGRAGFGPKLELTYDSGHGNGPFGFGWNLSLASITRKTDKGLPQYDDDAESDVYVLSDADDLVPLLLADGSRHVDLTSAPGYVIHRYRPRVESLFVRIERWTESATHAVHWRVTSRDNVLTLYGKDADSRIADAHDANRVFAWLIAQTRDDKGNAAIYDYKAEDAAGVDLTQAQERNRGAADDPRRRVQRYPKRVRYGNRVPLLDARGLRPAFVDATALANADWMFEVVFDYGEHDAALPLPTASGTWLCRHDAFSAYRAGFEIRSYRLCQRVLMFHHFASEPGVGLNCLVRSTDFVYRNTRNNPDDLTRGNPLASFIARLTQSGYVRAGAGYSKRSLPPLDFSYSEAELDPTVREIDADSLGQLPQGLDGKMYTWADLDGEGVSGILTEQGGNWLYKRNRGCGRFDAAEPLQLRPASARLAGGRQQLLDLAGDGRLDVVDFARPAPGYFARGAEQDWEPFRSFTQLPNIPWNDPNLKFVDLDGDGLADVLITEQDAFTWHASLGGDGFGPARKVHHVADEERGPHLLLADGRDTLFIADMSGDGLADLVRIRNGEVCYWPNLGYGRFGAKVTMDAAPWFDRPDQFDGKRLRLADLDGSGNTDIVYLGGDGVDLYFNQSGNAWSERRRLTQFPACDDLAAVSVADLLGTATMCLVWSSPLAGAARSPLRYIDLMGGIKPHLMTACSNNLGSETHIAYAPSTRFYLADRDAGTPWVTRLAFPVHVVERVETLDRVSRNRFTTRYVYHHGYFDGVEREFRGFGLVEQFDTEELGALSASGTFPDASNIDEASYVPPVHTKTWYHTGAWLGGANISAHFAHEYYREGDPATNTGQLGDAPVAAMLLPDSPLPDGLDADEMREACRALKGSILRQEIYADDGTAAADRPYSVSERNYTLKRLQGFGPNRHAVFFPHARETIDCRYERALYQVAGKTVSDPRITHAAVLHVDDFGNELQSVAVAYGRRYDDPDPALRPDDRATQKKNLSTATESRYTNAIDTPGAYRTPQPAEMRTFEIVKLGKPAASAAPTPLFAFEDLRARLAQAGDGQHDLDCSDLDATGAVEDQPYRRTIQCVRNLYRRDDLSGVLALGVIDTRGLPYASYKLALTPDLLTRSFSRSVGAKTENLVPAPAATLGGKGGDQGGYVDLDGNGNWWLASGRVFYAVAVDVTTPGATAAAELAEARQHFFLSRTFADPFDNVTVVDYDAHGLLAVRTQDAAQNVVVVRNDYRVLLPQTVTDPNGNRSAAAFDARGFVAGTVLMGKDGETLGDSLDGFEADPSAAQLSAFFTDPRGTGAAALLAKATLRFVYDLDRYAASGAAAAPVYVATIVRETHLSDLPVGGKSAIQTSFSYSDGLGREIQHKLSAEDGPIVDGGADVSPRWVGSGWTIFNNKGKPVRQYEPFFDATHEFKFGFASGVSPVLFYDPPGRVVATLHPDHSWEKVVFDPWRQTSWDVNDTALIDDPKADTDVGASFARIPADDYQPTWYARRIGGGLGPQQQQAANKIAAHAATPTSAYLDTLGRVFLTFADNGKDGLGNAQKYAMRSLLDVEGNVRVVIDALDRRLMRYEYDLIGTRIRQSSMEAGERWTLDDAAGKAIRQWDSRGQEFRSAYDALRRPLETYLSNEDMQEALISRTVYGETQPNAESANLRTRVLQQFDQAGVASNLAYDFKGNLVSSSRQLAADYRGTLDWSGAVARDAAVYTTATAYDALSRPLQSTAPDGSVIRLAYNVANLLESVDVNLRGVKKAGQPVWTSFVDNIDYDAKAQRTLIEYGNGASTAYTYHAETFRLVRLLTTRTPTGLGAKMLGLVGLKAGAKSDTLQDLNYTYDPAGNITYIRDDAQQTVYFRNKRVEPSCDYTYDAIYRLIQANGREHLGQNGGQPNAPTVSGPDDAFRTDLDQPGDGTALGTYVEQYLYDAVGNILALQHRGSDPANPGWTRNYTYAETSLLEPGKKSNRLSATSVGGNTEKYRYDGSAGRHGNITAMPHLPTMQWDFQDQLKASARQVVNTGTPETTWYVYDAAGQRVRKVVDAAAADGTTPVRKSERLYLGPFEIHREYAPDGVAVQLERQTLHVMDDKQRIALVETRSQGDDGTPAQLVRYQCGNHAGSASLELDDGANVVSYEEYFPFGATSYQAADKNIKAAAKRYRYAGKERDEENGFYYNGARYYVPWLGRWPSCDPLGIRGGQNLYVYAENRPTIASDPTGKIIWFFVAAVVVVASLTAVSEAGAPTNEEDVKRLKPHISDTEFAAHTAVTGISMAVGNSTAGALKGATPVVRGMVSGYAGGATQGIGDQAIDDVKQGKASPVSTYLKRADDEGTAGAVTGGVLEGASAGLKKAVPALKRALPGKAVIPEGEAPHVGASPKTPPKTRARMTVADAGKDKCVGNVCAIMKNDAMRAGPESGYTVKELEKEFGVDFGRTKTGGANPAVATPDRAVGTIERVTGMRATNRANPVNFAQATGEGKYAIFLGDSHVVYAKIGPGGRVSILDANVGRGWSSWSDFLAYAEKNPSLYGPNPARLNKAFRFVNRPAQ